MVKVRTYLDVVPEAAKEMISRDWGDRKSETFVAAKKHGVSIDQGKSFNRIVAFSLDKGYYHLVSQILAMKDVSIQSEMRSKINGLIGQMVEAAKNNGCTPLFASNICDWDSAYAKEVGASVWLRDMIIDACIKNEIVLTGGETANLGEQLGRTGMGWMFTMLSRYEGKLDGGAPSYKEMDMALRETFSFVAEPKRFEIVHAKGMPLLHIKEKSKFLITADGSGSKSIVCEEIDKRTDIKDTLASAGDDPAREGAFPIIASIGVHCGSSKGRKQMIGYMNKAGEEYLIPLVGSVFHEDGDVYTYTMNGTVLSEVRKSAEHIGKNVEAGLSLVLLYEEQRSNGMTLQRRIFEDAFGLEWYMLKSSEAMSLMREELDRKYANVPLVDTNRTLGELVAQPSTPYFRVDSMMDNELLDKIKLRINVSSGGLVGKTRRALEPFGLGADYSDIFEAPQLVLLLEMASRLKQSKGTITDDISYYTWGCGTGSVIATTAPADVVDYYNKNGIIAKVGGKIIADREIKVASRGFDSMQKNKPHILKYRYTDSPLG